MPFQGLSRGGGLGGEGPAASGVTIFGNIRIISVSVSTATLFDGCAHSRRCCKPSAPRDCRAPLAPWLAKYGACMYIRMAGRRHYYFLPDWCSGWNASPAGRSSFAAITNKSLLRRGVTQRVRSGGRGRGCAAGSEACVICHCWPQWQYLGQHAEHGAALLWTAAAAAAASSAHKSRAGWLSAEGESALCSATTAPRAG